MRVLGFALLHHASSKESHKIRCASDLFQIHTLQFAAGNETVQRESWILSMECGASLVHNILLLLVLLLILCTRVFKSVLTATASGLGCLW